MLDLLSLQLLLSIIAASGIIAYVADRLGKKLGKKRLSIRVGRFSLRPKHVATLGTVAMGLAVSVITIALVAAASKDARTWLLEGRQLLIQRDQLRKENRSLEADKERLGRESKQLTDSNRELNGTNVNLKNANSGLQKSLESERGRLAEIQAERARLVAEKDRLGGEVASLRRQLSTSRLALNASQSELSASRAALTVAAANLASKKTELEKTNKELSVSRINVQVAQKNAQDAYKKSLVTYKRSLELETRVSELESEVNQGEAKVADLVAQRQKAEQDLALAQGRFEEAQKRLAVVYKDLVDAMTVAESQQGFLNSGFKSSRTEPLTFRAREEVGRVIVPGGADTAAAQAALTSLIRQARLEAADRGAKSHRTGGQTFEVADIFERQDPKTKTVISSEELKNAVIARAAGRVEDQVLVATSSFNAFAGEPVSLDISVLPNPVIYHQGEMLSEARIDGSLPEEEIFAQISEFLRSRVKERAMEDRMIPKAGTDAPFGVVPSADMFALVRDVKRVGRPVRVQALAQDNIHAADPLRLEFRLK